MVLIRIPHPVLLLDRLPALRGGFDTLSPAARDRLLALVEEGPCEQVDTLPTELAPATLAAWVKDDLTARQIIVAKGLLLEAKATTDDPAVAAPVLPARTSASAFRPADRWRLLLGRPGSGPGLTGRAGRLATALDELYGAGRGEGSGPGLAGGGRGGREAPYPGVREWSDELGALFGPGIREEVPAAAAGHGRTDVLETLAPEVVRPSVGLLRTVLQHAGGLPEARLVTLRPLVKRLVDELSRELATTLRPALTGLTLPRPSHRRGDRLDLDRTIRANLATARPGDGGTTVIVPERPVFRTRATQADDWRLILVVAVSGSMEASTIWAALIASILAGVPALTTHFVAFSTSVVDLSGRVDDPLGLLLEVRVGGGTHIAAGLRHARELVTVPSRTLIAVVSDFEEGYPFGGLLGEARTLVNEGCHLLGAPGGRRAAPVRTVRGAGGDGHSRRSHGLGRGCRRPACHGLRHHPVPRPGRGRAARPGRSRPSSPPRRCNPLPSRPRPGRPGSVSAWTASSMRTSRPARSSRHPSHRPAPPRNRLSTSSPATWSRSSPAVVAP